MRHRVLLKEKQAWLFFFSNEDPQKYFVIMIKAFIPVNLTNGKTSFLLIK